MNSVHEVVDLSLIVPCYKDADHLRSNALAIIRVLESLRIRWEIIFVNDASPDDCRKIIDQLIAEDTTGRLRLVDHQINTGRGRAVHDGIMEAQGRFCGFLDIDLEVSAVYILSMLLALEAGADVVCAERIYKLRWWMLHRVVLSRGYSWLSNWILRSQLSDSESGFKFFRRASILPILDLCRNPGWFWDTEIMVRSQLAGLRIESPLVLFVRNSQKATTVRLFHDVVDYFRQLWRLRQELNRESLPKSATSTATLIATVCEWLEYI